jgi:hypothetical protein
MEIITQSGPATVIFRQDTFEFRIHETAPPASLRPHEAPHQKNRHWHVVEFIDDERLVDISWFSPGPGMSQKEFIACAVHCFTLTKDDGIYDEETPQPWRIKAWQKQNRGKLYDLEIIVEELEARETA